MHFACFALCSYEISAFYCWQIGSFLLILRPSFRKGIRRGARVVEEARLESVYTPKAYHGFESRSLR